MVGYAPHEEQMFFEGEEHTDVVNWAMRQKEDPTLQGELQYLHTHRQAALRTARRIAKCHGQATVSFVPTRTSAFSGFSGFSGVQGSWASKDYTS